MSITTTHNDLVAIGDATDHELRNLHLLRLIGFTPEELCGALVRGSMFSRLADHYLAMRKECIEKGEALDRAYTEVVRATVEADGCDAGKQAFLEAVGVPDEYMPNRTYIITLEFTVEDEGFGEDGLEDRLVELADEELSSTSLLSLGFEYTAD